MHNKVLMITSVIGVMLFSCNKGENFIDNTSSFPLGWKSSDSLPVIAYNMKDTVARIVNVGTCPLGVEVNPNFGKLKSSLYINFETTLSSVSFSFASIDFPTEEPCIINQVAKDLSNLSINFPRSNKRSIEKIKSK